MKSSHDKQRKIGLLGATSVGVGAIVGGGILALAGVAFATTGPAAILAFGLNGVIAMLTALTFAEMASRFPESGGTYVFSKKVLSVQSAFLVGWVVWFASIVAAVLYAIGFAFFFTIMVTDLWNAVGGDAPTWLVHSYVVTCVAVLTTVLLAISQMRKPAGGGQWINFSKLAVFTVLIAGGFWALARQPVGETQSALQPFLSSGFSGLIQAMGYTFIAMQGFDLIAAIGGEVRNPSRTLPRAIILSLAIALIIYLPLLFVIATVGVPPGQTIATAAAADTEGIVAIAAEQFLGRFGYWLVIVAALLSMFSALQANLFAASQIARAMSIDRTLPAPMGVLHAETGTPVIAITVTAALVSLILIVLPDVGAAGAAASLIFLITFALTHWVAILARRRSSWPPPFRVPLFPAVPVIGGLACIGLAVFQGIAVPLAGFISMFWLSVGGVLFLALFARRALVRDASTTALDPELMTLRGRAPLVLVPVANPQNAEAMIMLANALVPANIGRVLMQTVAVAPTDWQPDDDPTPIQRSQAVLREMLRASANTGIRVETLTTIASQPMEEIERVARLHRCESVLLGFSEISEGNQGSQLESLLGTLDANVVVLRSGKDWRLTDVRRILVPIAGRGGHDHLRAVLLGSLFRSTKCDLTFLRVLPTSATEIDVRVAQRDLIRLVEDEVGEPCNVEVVQSDDALATVVERADEFDLLILGVQRHGRRKKLFGSFTRQVAQRTACTIIVMSRRG